MRDPAGKIDSSLGGGEWSGGDRKKKRGRFTKEERDKKTPTKKGLFVLLAVVGVVAVFFVVGFVLLSSFLAAAVGEGWMHFVLTVLLVICVPLAIAFWAVRPLTGRIVLWWWTGVFGAPYVLATLGLVLGVPGRSALVLRHHGAWLPRILLGPKDSLTRGVARKVTYFATLIGKQDFTEEKDIVDPEAETPRKGKEKKTEAHPLTFRGKRWSNPSRVPIKGQGRRMRGYRVPVSFKAGVYIVRGRAGQSQGKPGTFTLDTRASRVVLSPEAATRLGLKFSENGPMVEMRLKNGKGKYPVVLLDTLALKRAKVRNIAAAVCGPCVHEGITGNIGINFLQHFRTAVDGKRKTLTLRRRKGKRNQALDVEPFVDFSRVKGKWRGGNALIKGRLGNRSPKKISSVWLDAVFLDEDDAVLGRASTQVKRVRPGHLVPFSLKGPISKEAVRFLLEVRKAYW
jgi:predicted aspartyl protease